MIEPFALRRFDLSILSVREEDVHTVCVHYEEQLSPVMAGCRKDEIRFGNFHVKGPR